MKWIAYWDRKVQKLGILELKMAQAAAMGFTLLIVKIFPRILSLSVWWFVALLAICALPVHKAFWLKKNGPSGAAAAGESGPPKTS